jgi:hypothetical protein
MELARMTPPDDPLSPTYRHQPLLPPPTPAKPRPRDVQRELQKRIDAIAQKAIDAAESMVEKLAAPPANQPPVAVMRRQMANTLRIWEVCANATCQKAHCCRGEPSHCLRYGLPLMPEAMLKLLKMRAPRGRRAALAPPRRTC